MSEAILVVGLILAFVAGALVYHVASGGKTPEKPLQAIREAFQGQKVEMVDTKHDEVEKALAEMAKPPDIFARRYERETVEAQQQAERAKAVEHIL